MKPRFAILVALAFSAEALAQDAVTLTDIEARLDPLETIANEDGIRRSIDLRIGFAYDSAEILNSATRQLTALAAAMRGQRLSAYRFQIIGHTDARGSEEYNRQLSRRRANAVAHWLSEQGVDKQRLEIIGQGEGQLLEAIAPQSQRQRRVEIIALPLKPDQPSTSDQAKSIRW